METLKKLLEKKILLAEKLDELTKKYGLSATMEQQKEVIKIGEELEKTDQEIKELKKKSF
ncbi:hypothetical protein [Flexithrix dorotheae]|uniref:hypothetical protein n=1 Tax=Flexithrix dorotheae TaxID=70993 RepID=UPI0003AA5A93|nr:hypothetical protein [Flexithrix dorotheae]